MHRRIAVVIACIAVFLAGCSNVLEGKPVSDFADPFSVAGMAATDGPSGQRPGRADSGRDVTGSDGGEVDQLASNAVTDIEEFWSASYPFEGEFRPVSKLISWDSRGLHSQFCGLDTYGLANAAYCTVDHTIGWDRSVLLPQLRDSNGDMSVVMVLAHEYGHAIAQWANLVRKDTPTLVAEQRADCLAGVYLRWVAEGKSSRFTLSTGDGLNDVLAAVLSFRDPLLREDQAVGGHGAHGSAFERISAFQFGFTTGPSSCAAINAKEIVDRRGDLPVLLPENQTGELPITEQSVRAMIEALTLLFAPASPPALSFDTDTDTDADTDASCPSARPSPPASFCPDTNTIVVDLDGLAAMGARSGRDQSLASGDNTAYSALTSRYMLALQHARGVSLDDAKAALRTACLTGVATTKMSTPIALSGGNTVVLTAGDVDEAVSGILDTGLAASDVNGESVPSGFARIDAFRLGVLGDDQRCYRRFG